MSAVARRERILAEAVGIADLPVAAVDAQLAPRLLCEASIIDVGLDRRLYVGGLCFLPVRVHHSALRQLAEFSYLRVARKMPRLRTLRPAIRSWSGPSSFNCTLPAETAVDPGLHAAVFDGGLPNLPSMTRWVTAHDATGVGVAINDYLHHGAAVTSALLFGSLRRGKQARRPYSVVDHFRVLDADSGKDEDLYDVLHRIRTILLDNKYHFVNLSVGPEILIEDDDIHGWTAVLDDLLSDGETLATIAVGNGGERDAQLRYNRVQVPGDCVNALSVGAADTEGPGWRRASYSSVGTGRSPGLVKPDVLAFGGSQAALSGSSTRRRRRRRRIPPERALPHRWHCEWRWASALILATFSARSRFGPC